MSRLGYAVGQIFKTHSDYGGTQFNFLEIVVNSTAVAISTAHHPDTRDAQNAAAKFGIQILWNESTRIIGIDSKKATSSMSDEEFRAELTLTNRRKQVL